MACTIQENLQGGLADHLNGKFIHYVALPDESSICRTLNKSTFEASYHV